MYALPRFTRKVPHGLIDAERLAIGQRLRQLLVHCLGQEQRQHAAQDAEAAEREQRQLGRHHSEVHDERRYDAGHIAHDVDECDALGTHDGRQQFSGVLQANVVREVDAKTAHDGQYG